MSKKTDEFDFACYDAVHAAGEPITVKAIAAKLRMPSREIEVRRVLSRFYVQKALSRVKIRGIWHYFV